MLHYVMPSENIKRNLTAPVEFEYTATRDIITEVGRFKPGDTFRFKGDPLRMRGLATRSLVPINNAVAWVSPISYRDGYGRLAIEAVEGLIESGWRVSLAHLGALRIENTSLTIETLLNQPFTMYKKLVFMTTPDDPNIRDRNLDDTRLQESYFTGQTRFLYTMFETTRIHPSWADNINRGMDAIIVPSSFLVDTFRNSGVYKPIHVAPVGINTDFWQPGERQLHRFKHGPDNEIRVLINGNLTRRKNVAGAIQAFQEASQGAANWRLTIKAHKKHSEFKDYVLAPYERAGDRRITLLDEPLPTARILDLYQSHDIHLWAAYGEGIGLPPMEAMSCGLESILPYASGALDYASSETNYLVDVTQVPAHDFRPLLIDSPWNEVGDWWEPNQTQLATALRLASHFTKGQVASRYMRLNRHSLITAQSIIKILKQYE